MAKHTVSEAGFYGGKFLKPGATYTSDEPVTGSSDTPSTETPKRETGKSK